MVRLKYSDGRDYHFANDGQIFHRLDGLAAVWNAGDMGEWYIMGQRYPTKQEYDAAVIQYKEQQESKQNVSRTNITNKSG